MLPLTALRTQIKWILAVFIVIFTASVGFMYGTGGSRSNNERSGDFVVAKINGEELHISVFQQHLRSFIERNRIRDLSDKQMPLIYKAVLDEMVSNRAVIDEVNRLKISVPAEDVNKQLKQIESQYVTREQFMQVLRSQNSSLEQAKAEIARQLSIEKMLGDVAGGVVVSDDEVAKLYEMLQGNFTQPAGIEADFAQVKTKEAAEKLIEAAKTGDWGKAVELVSADVKISSEAGKPERIAETEMKDKLEPVSKLADGEFSAPIEVSSQDYFVFHRVRAVSEEVRPLSEVSEGLKNMLLQSKKAEVQRDYVKGLADKMKVEIVAEDLFTVPSDDVKPETASADQKPAEEVKPTEEKKAEEVKPAETPATTEQKPAEEKKAEDVKPADASAAAEQKPAEEKKADDVKPAEAPAPEQKPEAEKPAAEQAK